MLDHTFGDDLYCDVCNYVDTAKMFTDVKQDDWFKGSVDYVVREGLMNGTGTGTTFSPTTPMSRAMLVTVLWRLDGSPEPSGRDPFTDLTQSWYMTAVNWAYQNSIVNGVASDKFAPDLNITREQVATILFRYCAFKGISTEERADISAFPDASSVSGFALDAISWANAVGLINGANIGGTVKLAPLNNASRAEVATILMRFCSSLN